MKTLQFEAVKIALKQDKTGYVLTLNMHPDEVPTEVLRDFVGARYQVVMVRLNDHEQPLDRQEAFESDRSVKLAGALCRESEFWHYLRDGGHIFDPTEKDATDWLREHLGVKSRSELKNNPAARIYLDTLNKEYMEWKRS